VISALELGLDLKTKMFGLSVATYALSIIAEHGFGLGL